MQLPFPNSPIVPDSNSINQALASQPKATVVGPPAMQVASPQLAPPSQQFDYQAAVKAGYSPTQIKNYLEQNSGFQPANAPANWDQGLTQNTILPPSPITENFGQYQPGLEVFSNGMTYGTGFGAQEGTPVALPPGEWEIQQAYNQAQNAGIGDNENSGYGNSILAKNRKTGEALRFSHLSQVHVSPGDVIKGNYIIGATGQTGNTTGPHLNLEYYDPNGQINDVLQSPYAQYLPIQQ